MTTYLKSTLDINFEIGCALLDGLFVSLQVFLADLKDSLLFVLSFFAGCYYFVHGTLCITTSNRCFYSSTRILGTEKN